MDLRQKKAIKNIKECASYEIGGLENDLMDYGEDEKEYQEAKKILSDRKRLAEYVYMYATSQWYHGGGWVSFGAKAQEEIRDINFCGKEWLLAQCEKAVEEEGY